jgi:hypothetical protein
VTLSGLRPLDTRNFAEMASGTHRVNSERIAGTSTATARTPGGANRAQQAVMVWREIPVPVIAAVHGVAFGGGFQLCLGADMRFVARGEAVGDGDQVGPDPRHGRNRADAGARLVRDAAALGLRLQRRNKRCWATALPLTKRVAVRASTRRLAPPS